MTLVPCLLWILDLRFSRLVRLGVMGSRGGAWGEVPPRGSGDSHSPLFPPSQKTVYIKLKSNNNLIRAGGCSLAWSIAFCAILGLLLHLGGESCDCFGVFQCWSSLAHFGVSKLVTPPGNGVRLTSLFVGGFSLWGSLECLGDCFSLGVGLEACRVWHFLWNSSPRPQIVFHFKTILLLLHSCVVRLVECWGLGSAGVGEQF